MAERERDWDREREREWERERERERDRYRNYGHAHAHALTRIDEEEEEQQQRRRREEEIEDEQARRRRIDEESLLSDNQRLAATNLSLKEQLALAQVDLRCLSLAQDDVKSHRDSEIRQVYESSLKVEADLRLLNLVSAELNQVMEDKHQLSQDNLNLTHQLQTIQSDLHEAHSQLKQLPLLEDELQTVRSDIQTGRAAIQHEKETRSSNLDHQKLMDNNIITMSRHIHKLRSRLANAHQTLLSGGYGANYATTGYPVLNQYMDPTPPPPPYATAIAVPPPHQVQFGVEGISQLTPQNGPIGMLQPHNNHSIV